jgi:hypothetical protein
MVQSLAYREIRECLRTNRCRDVLAASGGNTRKRAECRARLHPHVGPGDTGAARPGQARVPAMTEVRASSPDHPFIR